MKKFLHSDCLRAVQFFFVFFFLTVQKRVNLVQKGETNQAYSDWSMIKETHRWSIKSFAFKSSAGPGWRNFSLIA